MSRWFRAYEDALNDPKIQRLPGEQFKIWFNLLCVASANKGSLPQLEELAFALRMSEDALRGHLDALQAAGLIDVDPDTLAMSPHNWSGRQYQSDTSSERVKRFRNAKRNADETVDETPPDTEADSEPEIETEQIYRDANASLVAESAALTLKIERDRRRLVEDRARLHLLGCDWNSMAADLGLPQIEGVDPGSTRERAALARIREGCDFSAVFTKIRASPFLRGERGTFRCTFKWIINKTNFENTMEGNYDEVRKTQPRPHQFYGAQR